MQRNREMGTNGQTLVDHLAALRAMLLRVLAATALALPPGLALALPGIHWLVGWISPPELAGLRYLAPFEVFVWQMKIAALMAGVLACPFILWEVWKFVAPGLREHERRAAKWWVGGAAVLFASGVALCVGVVLPMVMRFAAGFQSGRIEASLRLDYVMETALWMSRGFGLVFQFPLLILMLVKFGVARVETLARARPYMIVGLLFLSAVLTPPDVLSQVAMALPAWLLFEASLLVARLFKRHEKPLETAPGGDYDLDMYTREQGRRT